jgi:hypothetical protein
MREFCAMERGPRQVIRADRVCYGGSGFVYLLHFFVSSTVFFTQARVPFGELILS